MAARVDSRISKQHLSTVVTTQPQSSSLASAGISSLSTVIKALRKVGVQEYDDCCCFYFPKENLPLPASALLIGRRSQEELIGRTPQHVLSLKDHLLQLNVKIFESDADYQGSRDDLHETISRFLSQRNGFLFILYYSGPTDEKGDWLFTTSKYGEENHDYIRLDTIVKKWKERSFPHCQLLIIVDADNSGAWVEKVRIYESKSNISIMSSSVASESILMSGIGDCYTQSLIGVRGGVFYPNSVQKDIDRLLSGEVSVPPVFCCLVAF